MINSYSYEEALRASIDYFEGDEFAAKIFLKKYALKDRSGNIFEDTPEKMHRRLSKEFARIESNYKNPLSEQEIFELLDHFKYVIPGGSPMSGIGNEYQIQSLSNCYVIGNNEDSYASIMLIDEEQVHIMRRRGGVGHDLSHLRSKGASTTCAAQTSTGIVPFAERYSNTTREVAQDGRRGALMLSLDIRHPDAEDFIDSKLEQGKITGANISVKLTNEFMNCVKNNSEFKQQFPIDSDNPKYFKNIKAKKLWNKIIHNAWKSAEPGVFFWDRVLSESPAKGYGDSYIEVSSNPCVVGETLILTSKGEFKIEDLVGKTVNIWNGEEWSSVVPKVTGETNIIYEIVFSNGKKIRCTGYHNFYIIKNGKEVMVEAKNLNLYDNLVFNLPKEHVEIYVSSIYVDVLKEEVKTYCFTEEKSHKGVFNGILTGQCGEIPMSKYSSCILLAINLYSFVEKPFTDKAYFNFDLFNEYSRKAYRLIDDIVDLEIEKINKIIEKVESDPENEITKIREIAVWKKILHKISESRRVGLGITAEGDMIAALNMRYGTKEATNFQELVHKQLAVNSYTESINLAKERGCFEIWSYQNDIESDFIKRIIYEFSDELHKDYRFYGRRNIASQTIAPTGTVSLMTQTTSGIEPCFLVSYKRRRKIQLEDTTSRVDFIDENGDKWEEANIFHHKFIDWYYNSLFNKDINGIFFNTKKECRDYLERLDVESLNEIIKKSPYYKATSNDIDWVEKVRCQGLIQKWIDHSISVTVNIPENTPEDIVSQIYMMAYESGCKGCTIYREGSRSGVLVSNDKKEEQEIKDRPKSVNCDINHITYKGKKYVVLVGILNNKPYEIFAFEHELDKKYKKGKLTKIKSRTYDLEVEGDGIICNIVGEFDNPLEGSLTRQISLNLKNSNIEDVYIQLQKEGNVSDYNRIIARTLKKYLPDEIELKDKCPECGSKLHMKEGCITCICGYSKCG